MPFYCPGLKDEEHKTKKSSGDNQKGKSHFMLMPVYQITGTQFEDKITFKYVREHTQIHHAPQCTNICNLCNKDS